MFYTVYARRDLGKLDFSIATKANDFKRNDSSVTDGCETLITLYPNSYFSLITLSK